MCRKCDEAWKIYDRDETAAWEGYKKSAEAIWKRYDEEIAKCEGKKVG